MAKEWRDWTVFFSSLLFPLHGLAFKPQTLIFKMPMCVLVLLAATLYCNIYGLYKILYHFGLSSEELYARRHEDFILKSSISVLILCSWNLSNFNVGQPAVLCVTRFPKGFGLPVYPYGGEDPNWIWTRPDSQPNFRMLLSFLSIPTHGFPSYTLCIGRYSKVRWKWFQHSFMALQGICFQRTQCLHVSHYRVTI